MPSIDLTQPEPPPIKIDYTNAALKPETGLPDPLLIQINELNNEHNHVLLDYLEAAYGPKIIEFIEQGRACIYNYVPDNYARIDSFGEDPDDDYSNNIPLRVVAQPNIDGGFLQNLHTFFLNSNHILSQPIEGHSFCDLYIDVEAAHELGIASTASVAGRRYGNFVNNLVNKFSKQKFDTSGDAIKAVTSGTWPYAPKP